MINDMPACGSASDAENSAFVVCSLVLIGVESSTFVVCSLVLIGVESSTFVVCSLVLIGVEFYFCGMQFSTDWCRVLLLWYAV